MRPSEITHLKISKSAAAAKSADTRPRECEWKGADPLVGQPNTLSEHGNHILQVTLCKSKKSDFATFGCSWDAFLGFAKSPSERINKDGPAIIFGEVRDSRCDANVMHVSALAYEIDGKMILPEITRRLENSCSEAVLWTTHNHLRTSQPIGLESYRKWHRQKFGIDGLPTNEGIKQFCAEKKQYQHLTNVELASGGKVRFVREYGRKVAVLDITHDPEHKVRIVFPLLTAIPINQPAGRSISDYKAIYHAHGRAAFGDAYSTESQNPSRLHYLPSHPPDMTGEVILIPGSLLDPNVIWQGILLEDAKSHATSKPSAPRASRSLAVRRMTEFRELEYILRHIPADLEYPDWFRCIAAIFHETRGSDAGAELAHSWSSEDPRYDFNQVERIWDSLSLEHKKPTTIGTLTRLAKTHNENYRPYRPIRPSLDFILNR